MTEKTFLEKVKDIKTYVKTKTFGYIKIYDPEHANRIYDLLINNIVYDPQTGIELLYMAFYYRNNAEKHLQYNLLAHEKGNADATSNLAIRYEKVNPKLSEIFYSKACHEKSFLAYNNFSIYLKSNNRITEAIHLLYSGIELFPKKVDLYLLLAKITLSCNVVEKEKLFLIAYSHNPKKMCHHLVKFYLKLEDTEKVISVFNEHCAKYPDDLGMIISKIHNIDAFLTTILKEKNDRIRDLELLVEHYKYRPEGYLNAKDHFEKSRFM